MVHTSAFRASLGDLADPRFFTEPLELANEPTERLLLWLGDMLRIRLAEEAIAEFVESGAARCPCHLGIGQEAVAVGVSAHLRASDRVYGGHRSHAHYMALGGDVFEMFAEVLGRVDGVSKGMGGSMHLYKPSIGFHGSVPIVGATIPIAVGAAIAAQMDRNGDVAVCYFGDGACEEGVLHESLNLAAVMKLPVLFICENNLYSSHLDIKLRQPSDSVARFASAHSIATEIVDGNDVIAVAQASARLISRAREGGGAGFMEAVTYRWRGHVGADENIDVGVRRSRESVDAWKRRDPVRRLHQALIARGSFDDASLKMMNDQIAADVKAAAARALKCEYPPGSALLDLVYSPAR